MEKIDEVCLVEDNEVQIFLLTKFLERTGLVDKVVSFENGKSAFDEMKLRADDGIALPNLIFLDINMPIWDGWQFFGSFIELPGSDRVVTYILTSSLSNEDRETAKKFGLGDRYLTKPMNYEDLTAILQKLQHPL